MGNKQISRKIMLIVIFYSFWGALFAQSNLPIEILDKNDVKPSIDYIDLPIGTIIARDTSLIIPIINNNKVSYTKFENMISIMPDSLGFSMDSIVVKQIGIEQKIFIYCTQKY